MSQTQAADQSLIAFLKDRMSMTDVYQPAIIKELLLHGGRRSRSDLARLVAQYDASIQGYYEKVVMRWPRKTLTKHKIVDYHRGTGMFVLREYPVDGDARAVAIEICDEKITAWLERKALKDRTASSGSSARYEVLKAAGGRCQLCGIPAALRPIDVDHIVPESKANRHGKVLKDGIWIDAGSRQNLQALCMTCNRAKRSTDNTDFRPASRLVRDGVAAILQSEGTALPVRKVSGARLTQALFDKLVDEHAELIAEKDHPKHRLEEMADMIEVILALAYQQGASEEYLMGIVHEKRRKEGTFSNGVMLQGSTG